MTDVRFLGTAAALPTADRTNTALAVVGDGSDGGLLIDCGGDIYGALLRAGLAGDALGDLFITHAHIDHIGSLPSLIESFRLGGRTAPLRIWGLPEVIAVVRNIVAVFSYELTLSRWTFPVTFTDLQPDQPVTLGGFPARILRMDHAIPSAGIRLELPGGALAYTSDTQPTAAIQLLGDGAHTLITECTYLSANQKAARAAKHLTAAEAGQQAALCGVQRLALVHVGLGGAMSLDAARAEAAQSFAGEIITPQDGARLSL